MADISFIKSLLFVWMKDPTIVSDHQKLDLKLNHKPSEMNNYFRNLVANLSNKENNESNLLTLLKNLPDENYKQSPDFSHNFSFSRAFC